MDLATKEQFKWKFYRLVVILNIILVTVAIAVVALFLAPEGYRIPLFILLVLSAVVFTVYFWFQYRKTREWLHNQE
jgi:heme/copper-type cytochrome/quinol oxidase subunit 4